LSLKRKQFAMPFIEPFLLTLKIVGAKVRGRQKLRKGNAKKHLKNGSRKGNGNKRRETLDKAKNHFTIISQH